MKAFLIYQGSGHLRGVPARNLSEKEARMLGGADFLVSTGLYRLAKQEKPKPAEDKALFGGKENKAKE